MPRLLQSFHLANIVLYRLRAGCRGFAHDNAANEFSVAETNLANLIMDLRDEWKNPNLPVSIPVSGFFGYDAATRSPGMAHVTAAQFAVGDPATHPELHGHVASMETRGFWREPQLGGFGAVLPLLVECGDARTDWAGDGNGHAQGLARSVKSVCACACARARVCACFKIATVLDVKINSHY